MNKKSVLGRGLGSILRNPETDITTSSDNKKNIVGNINTIKIDAITTNPFQPRSKFNQQIVEIAKNLIKNCYYLHSKMRFFHFFGSQNDSKSTKS